MTPREESVYNELVIGELAYFGKLRLVAACFLALASSLSLAENRALLIGIDEYQDSDGISRLSGAVNDVNDLGSALKTNCGFTDVKVISGSAASRNAILKEIDSFAQRCKPGDVAFFYFAGHGFQPGAESYLLPYDAVAGSESVMRTSSIRSVDVSESLSKMSAELLFCGFDMCRNDPRAQVARDLGSSNSMTSAMSRDLQVRTSSSGGGGPKRVLRIFSSSKGQRSWEKKSIKRGFFSFYLEQGLRGEAARKETGEITVSSLIEYLKLKVPAAVNQERGVDQIPDFEPMGAGVLSFRLAKVIDVKKSEITAFERGMQIIGKRYLSKITAEEAKKAQSYFELAIKENPRDAKATFRLGCMFGVQNDKVREEAFYRKAIELDPTYPLPYNNLGVLLIEAKKDSTGGEAMYRKAIQLDPTLVETYFNLGNTLYVSKKDYAGAEEMYNKVIQLEPNFARAYNNLGILRQEQKKDYKGSEAAFRKSIQLDPSDVRPYIYLGRLLQFLKRDKDLVELNELAKKNGVEF